MAKVYLEANDSFELSSDATIFGATGSETVLINGTPDITLDPNVERVELSGDVADYTFEITGTIITVYSGGSAVVTFTSLNQVTDLVFADGAAELSLTGLNTATLGGTAISTTAAAVVPAVFNTTDTSDTADGGTTPVEGQTFTLTTGDDISGVLVGSAGTTSTDGNDTFIATTGTLGANDVLVGGAGTDTLNVAATVASTAPFSVVSIENVNFNVTSFADIAMDANNIISTGTTITVNNLQAGGTTAATINNVESGATVVAGSGVTGTFTVDADGYVTINGGSATKVVADLNNVTTQSSIVANSVTGGTAVTTGNADIEVAKVDDVSISSTSAKYIIVSGDAGTDDAATISAKNASTTTVVGLETALGGAGKEVEYLTLSGNGGAVTYDLDATDDNPTKYTFVGDQDVMIVGTAAQFTGDTASDTMTAGTSTIKIDANTAATFDLDALIVDVIEIAGTTTAGIYQVADTQAVKISADATASTYTSVNATDTAETLNLTVKVSQGGATNVDDFETVNLTVDDGAATTGTITLNDLNASNATAGVVNVFGADNLVLTGADAKFLNAATFTGTLTATLAADLLKVTGGNGNDTIVGSQLAFTVDGGAGTDTIRFEGVTTTDLTAVAETISNVEILALDTVSAGIHNLTVDTAFISGKSYVVTGTGANDILTVITSGTGTLDLSSLTVDDTDVAVVITTTATNGVANNITGSNADDTTAAAAATGVFTIDSKGGADVIVTGTAADFITLGEGADSVDADTGADTINLTEVTAAVDTVIIAAGDSTEAAMDKISGFTTHATTGDILKIATAALNSAAVSITDATSYTTETDSGTITAAVSTTGILTLGGTAKANVDTLAEWIDIAEAAISSNLLVQDTENTHATIAFEFSGNTYVVQGTDSSATGGGAITYATEAVVELTGVTGITGLSATAAANVIDIA